MGVEMPYLLPFLFFWWSFGRREPFSTTVFESLEEFWAVRPPLYYRFCFSAGVLGGEITSLLPFLFF
ncbi:MAG: hypothetical protein U9Q88_03075, partial [Bacillota bacterium]|nr:hypothetical protein [Bacillota bacterium]